MSDQGSPDYVVAGEAITSAPRVNAALDIVKELAERGPFIDNDSATCADEHCFVSSGRCLEGCDLYECPHETRDLMKPEHHEPTCTWRRARAMYPAAGAPDPEPGA